MVNSVNSHINTPYISESPNKKSCAPAKLENSPPEVKFNAEPDPNANSPQADIFKKGDVLLPANTSTGAKVAISNAASIPEYAVRGLRGDQNADFHERLTISKVPYYLGGPTLVWCFSAGIKESVPRVKKMAAGVALYYIGKAVAAKTIDLPVKFFRGVDLNNKYRAVVNLNVPPTDGSPTKKVQYRDALISCDWSRTDLLYDKKANTDDPRAKNSVYDRLARKMGANEEQNDSDSSVKPNLRKLIIMSRAWKYALAVPFIALSAGMAANDCWANTKFSGIKKELSENVYGNVANDKKFLQKAKSAFNILVYNPFLKNVKTSFVEFYKDGIKNPKLASSKIGNAFAKNVGKATIWGTAAMIVLANLNILSKTSLKKKDIVHVSWFADGPKPNSQNANEKVQG